MATPSLLDSYSARDLGAHHGAATAVAWSCSAHRLASGGVDGCVKLWAPDRTRPGGGFNANLQQQQQNQNQNQPAAERPVGEIRLPASSSSGSSATTKARPPRINRLAWHPRLPEVLAVASDDGATVRLFDARSGEPCGGNGGSGNGGAAGSKRHSLVASFAPPSPVPRCTAISLAWCPPPPSSSGGNENGGNGGKKENLVAVGTDADVVSFFDAATGKLLALLPPPSPGIEVNEAVFSSCGTVFARAVGTHGAVELFSVDELLEKNSISSSSAGSSTAAAAPLPLQTPSDWRRQLGATTAKPFATLQGHTSTVFALSTVAASATAGAGMEGGSGAGSSGPASFLLASGGADGAAVVWDLRFGGSPLATCGAFDHQVKSVSLGGGWQGGGKMPPSGSKTTVGSVIAYSGEGDAVVVDDWTCSAASGSFLPPRDPTAPYAAKGNTALTKPYALRVFVPRVESVAWAPAVVSSSSAPSSSAAAAAGDEDGNGNGDSTPSKSLQQQSNAGALAFVRCIPAGPAQQGGAGGGRGGGGEVIGAIGLFAPPAAGAR